MKDGCKRCKFFEPSKSSYHFDNKTGHCRRNAPDLTKGPFAPQAGSPSRQWPLVAVDDWCGEFRLSSSAKVEQEENPIPSIFGRFFQKKESGS